MTVYIPDIVVYIDVYFKASSFVFVKTLLKCKLIITTFLSYCEIKTTSSTIMDPFSCAASGMLYINIQFLNLLTLYENLS
jgi:hypothetical protein